MARALGKPDLIEQSERAVSEPVVAHRRGELRLDVLDGGQRGNQQGDDCARTTADELVPQVRRVRTRSEETNPT